MLPEEEYQKLMDISPICTVDVLFFNKDKNKTLLFKRTSKPAQNKYFSIGGRLWKNEKMIDCAKRQTYAESGLKIDKKQLIFGGVVEDIHPDSKYPGINYHAINIVYGYILGSQEIKFDHQHNDYRWFSVKDKTLHSFIKTRIKALLSKL